MRDVLNQLFEWWQAGEVSGVGTVVGTVNSAPRQPGASIAVGPLDTVVGSVSGGCVESAVYDLANDVRDAGTPVLQRYGVSDSDAYAVGLTCGGDIDIFVQQVSQTAFPEFGSVVTDVRAGRPVAVATIIAGSDCLGHRLIVRPDSVTGSLGSRRLEDAVREDAREMLVQGRTATVHYDRTGERSGDEIAVFADCYTPRPRMIVFGATDFAATVARLGSFLGYRVTVCDARATFATAQRFPDADDVVVAWPHTYLANTNTDDRTVICVLTHDTKFDVPLLELALRRPLAYIGAMGSRRTNAERLAKLRDRGLTDSELARLRAPVGLDVGARTPEETAVSIAAEIIATRSGASGAPLRSRGGPIHQRGMDQRPRCCA